MYRIAVTAFLLIAGKQLLCQPNNKSIDEWRRAASRNYTDTNKIKSLIRLGVYYMQQPGTSGAGMDSAFYFLNEADRAAGSLKDMKWNNEVLTNLGNWYLKKGNISAGKNYYMKVIAWYESNKNIPELANCWNALGTAIPLNDSACIAEKIKCFQQSRALFHSVKNVAEEAAALTNIGTTQSQAGQLYEAETELLQALDLYKSAKHPNVKMVYAHLAYNSELEGDLNKELQYKQAMVAGMDAINDTAGITNAYFGLATTYIDMGLYDKSLEWAEKAIAIDKKKSKFEDIYLETAMIVFDLTNLNRSQEALAIMQNVVKEHPPVGFIEEVIMNESMGDCYAGLKTYDLAETHYLKMVDLFDKNVGLKDEGKLSHVYVGGAIHHYKTIANFYLKFNKYEKAEFYLNKLFLIPKDLVKPLTLSRLYAMQFRVDSASGNLNAAIEHYKLFKQLNDSVFNGSIRRQIVELQIKYKTEKKEKDLQLLEGKEQSHARELQKSVQARNLTYALAGVLLLFVMAGYSRYRLKIRKNKQLQQQQEEINKQNEKLTAYIAVQQKLMQEKEWLMKEIHHRVKNNLQIVMSLLNSQSIYLKDNAALDAIKESQHRVHAISLIHQKLYQSDNLAVVDMKSYISEVVDYLAENLDATHRISFTVAIEPIQLDVAQAVPLGLIINEAVTNAVKYAFPADRHGHVAIRMLHTSPGIITLTICDDGTGLPENFDWSNTQSLGMNLMQGLCKQLDGKFDIESGNGLTVCISLGSLEPGNYHTGRMG